VGKFALAHPFTQVLAPEAYLVSSTVVATLEIAMNNAITEIGARVILNHVFSSVLVKNVLGDKLVLATVGTHTRLKVASVNILHRSLSVQYIKKVQKLSPLTSHLTLYSLVVCHTLFLSLVIRLSLCNTHLPVHQAGADVCQPLHVILELLNTTYLIADGPHTTVGPHDLAVINTAHFDFV